MTEWRFYAQRLITGTWLDRDMQIREVSLEWALSTSGTLKGTVDAITAKEIALDGYPLIDEWSTAIYAELDGRLKWGGIVVHSAAKENGQRDVEAHGFSAYPHGRIYEGLLAHPPGHAKYYQAEPFDIVRRLWDEVQADPTGYIGVTVDQHDSGAEIGGVNLGPMPKRSDYDTNTEYQKAKEDWQSQTDDPYELAWWNTQDMGDEINSIMSTVAGDYWEEVAWRDYEKTDVQKQIRLEYPQLGRRRLDLRFAEGENITVEPAVERDGEQYANFVLALGAGEDRSTLRRQSGFTDLPRVRRDKVVSAKDLYNFKKLEALAYIEHLRSRNLVYFPSIEVVDHPNAPLGEIQLGDEILVQTFTGFQNIARWVRITSVTMTLDDADKVELNVEYAKVEGSLIAGQVPDESGLPGDPGNFPGPGDGGEGDDPGNGPEPPPDPSGTTDTIRVATYNMSHGPTDQILNDLEKVAEDADVIGIQEGADKAEVFKRFLAKHDAWKIFSGDGNDKREKRTVSILYRKKIGDVKAKVTKLAAHSHYLGPVGHSPASAPNKYVTRLEIDHATTLRRLVFLNTHMIPSVQNPAVHGAEKERRTAFFKEQLKSLDDIIDEREGILFVTGDFNATPDFDPVAPLFTRVHLDTDFDTLGGRKVDYVCHRPHAAITVQSTKQVHTSSDHDQAIITYQIKGA